MLFLSGSSLAQTEKVSQENFSLPNSKIVNLNLKFASHITVKPWEKNEIGLKTTLLYSSEDFAKIHQQKVEEKGSALNITTDYDMSDFKNEDYNCWSCDNYKEDVNCKCLKVSYEVYAPQHAILNLETISGDIELLNFRGEIRVKTISGFVDFSLQANAKSDVQFKSVTGEIYTDFDINLDKGSTAYSKKVNTSINGGGSKISLETISGDIYFRKI